jgi:hypothetical protein
MHWLLRHRDVPPRGAKASRRETCRSLAAAVSALRPQDAGANGGAGPKGELQGRSE